MRRRAVPVGCRAGALLASAVAVALSGCTLTVSPDDDESAVEVDSDSGWGNVVGRPGEVIRVIDGDSLMVAVDGEDVEVRLIGINAPELSTVVGDDSCVGAAAHAALAEQVEGMTVGIDGTEVDRFGRTLAEVHLGELSINDRLVEQGWALALWSADNARVDLMRASADAGLGLWGDVCGPGAASVVIADADPNPPGDDNLVLDQEWVSLRNDGPNPVDLSGWTLKDETSSNRFDLGGVTLGSGATVTVRTGAASGDGDHGLGLDRSVWSNGGDTALLLDPAGVVVSHWFLGP